MAQSKAARRYAKAFFDLAVENGAAEAVRADLTALSEVLAGSPELARFLLNYSVSPDRRVQILGDLLERRGNAHKLLTRFVLFLEDRKRMNLLQDVLVEFERLYDAHTGILRVDVTSAIPLTPGQQAALCERLGRKFGKRIEAAYGENPALLGGFQVKVGDTVYDSSLETQLRSLNRKMATA